MTSEGVSDTVALERYLDRVGQLYPHGVARRLLVSQRGENTENRNVLAPTPKVSTDTPTEDPSPADPRLVVFLIVSNAAPLPVAEQQLLDSIIEKGLKRRTEETVVIPIAPEGSLPQIVQAAIASHAPKLVIAMCGGDGLGVRRAEGARGNGATLLLTHPLRDIATSQEIKREFWGHLQAGMRAL